MQPLRIHFDPYNLHQVPAPDTYDIQQLGPALYLLSLKNRPEIAHQVDLNDNLPYGSCTCHDFINHWVNLDGTYQIPPAFNIGCKHLRLIRCITGRSLTSVAPTITAQHTLPNLDSARHWWLKLAIIKAAKKAAKNATKNARI